MKIEYVNLKEQYKKERKQILKIIDKVLSTGNYITPNSEVSKFEKNISKICKTKHCIALNSGTDALTFALHMLGVKKGDEVITPPNSFIASTAVIVHLGAKPVFVDVKLDQNIDEKEIEKKITSRTKVIMPVHLSGRMCSMDKIMSIAKKYKISVVEDCAQSIMSKYKKKMSGSFGDFGCFSAHPLKNLNAIGDSGYLTTNNSYFYNKIKDLRTHGMSNRDVIKSFGYVSRMDNIQAAILNFRLKSLKRVIKKRRKNVEMYIKFLNDKNYFFSKEKKDEFNTYHTFVIQVEDRDKLKSFLKSKGILTSIHYPIPIHLQPASKFLGYKKNSFEVTENQSKKIITLPVNQFLKENQIKYISDMINKFYD